MDLAKRCLEEEDIIRYPLNAGKYFSLIIIRPEVSFTLIGTSFKHFLFTMKSRNSMSLFQIIDSTFLPAVGWGVQDFIRGMACLLYEVTRSLDLDTLYRNDQNLYPTKMVSAAVSPENSS